MKVRLTEAAVADLDEIGLWLLGEIGDRSIDFVRSLRQSCTSLGDMPFRFPIVSTHPSMTVRRRVHGNYLILYIAEDEEVRVLRIVHGARGYEGLLFPQD